MNPKDASQERGNLPPYVPYKTFDNALAAWKVVAPQRIDRGVLGSFAGTMQSWVLSALRYFELIDHSGIPTPALKQLLASEGQDRKDALRRLVQGYYPFVFSGGLDLGTATQHQLRERFTGTGAQGETAVKAMSFFLAMAEAAGFNMSPYLRMRKRRSVGPRRVSPRKPSEPVASESPAMAAPQGPRDKSWQAMLLDKFPPFDPSWPDDLKAKWFQGFERLMNGGRGE